VGRARCVIASALAFTLGSVLDNVLTYEYVVAEGRFSEANPFLKEFIYIRPLWMWFLRDFTFLAAVTVTLWGLYRISALTSPRASAVLSRWWVVLVVLSMLRILPAVHNLILVATGYETPLPQILYGFLTTR